MFYHLWAKVKKTLNKPYCPGILQLVNIYHSKVKNKDAFKPKSRKINFQ